MALGSYIGELAKVMSRSRNRMAAYQREIDLRRAKKPKTESAEGAGQSSEHAILRYLERKHGLDLGAIEAEMREHISGGTELGPNLVQRDGIVFILRSDGLVKTVLPTEFVDDEESLRHHVQRNMSDNAKFERSLERDQKRLALQTRVTWHDGITNRQGHVIGDVNGVYSCRCYETGDVHYVSNPQEGWHQHE